MTGQSPRLNCRLVPAAPRGGFASAAIGAAIGGAVAVTMARQMRQLKQHLAGSGAQILNTGTQLLVILPESVTFPTGSAVVNRGCLPALQGIAQSLRTYPDSTVRVVGHTDNVGTRAHDNPLSRDRALAVASILTDHGLPANRVAHAGQGSDAPVASNGTASGRARNRRVEIVITPTT